MLAGLSMLGLAHGTVAFAAVVVGALMLMGAKGTRRHKQLGAVYIPLMLAVNATAFGLYSITGGMTLFHALAAASLTSLVFAVRALWMWRRTQEGAWLKAHTYHMAYSYLGLVMAFASQILINPRFGLGLSGASPQSFWVAMLALNVPIYWVGHRIIRRRLDPLSFPGPGRRSHAS